MKTHDHTEVRYVEDSRIVELYWKRSEQAIAESERNAGELFGEDAEETGENNSMIAMYLFDETELAARRCRYSR